MSTFTTSMHPSWCGFQLANGGVMHMRSELFGLADHDEVRAVAEKNPWAGPVDLEKARHISMVVHSEARSLYYAKPKGRC